MQERSEFAAQQQRNIVRQFVRFLVVVVVVVSRPKLSHSHLTARVVVDFKERSTVVHTCHVQGRNAFGRPRRQVVASVLLGVHLDRNVGTHGLSKHLRPPKRHEFRLDVGTAVFQLFGGSVRGSRRHGLSGSHHGFLSEFTFHTVPAVEQHQRNSHGTQLLAERQCGRREDNLGYEAQCRRATAILLLLLLPLHTHPKQHRVTHASAVKVQIANLLHPTLVQTAAAVVAAATTSIAFPQDGIQSPNALHPYHVQRPNGFPPFSRACFPKQRAAPRMFVAVGSIIRIIVVVIATEHGKCLLLLLRQTWRRHGSKQRSTACTVIVGWFPLKLQFALADVVTGR